jgi:hypothetical protein
VVSTFVEERNFRSGWTVDSTVTRWMVSPIENPGLDKEYRGQFLLRQPYRQYFVKRCTSKDLRMEKARDEDKTVKKILLS